MPAPVRRILVAADDLAQRARLARLLKSSGLEVELASTLDRATSLVSQQRFAAAIIAFSEAIPTLAVAALRSSVPKILFLRSNEELRCAISHEVAVLPYSASDEQLLEHVNELIKPTDQPILPPVRIGKTVVDLGSRQFVNANGRECPLTVAEAALLRDLTQHAGKVRSRHELRQAVAGRGSNSFDRSIDMMIARLRNKLEPDPKHPRFIVTVPRSGYKLVGDASQTRTISENIDRRQLTFLSCRVAHWSSFSFECDAEELSEVSYNFRSLVGSTIDKWGGTIANSTVDRCIAQFCYPETTEHDAEYAVCAASEISKSIGGISDPFRKQLELKIGIATGQVAIRAGEAIGEALVAAAALRDAATPTTILVDTRTRKLLGDRLTFLPATPCELTSKVFPAFQIVPDNPGRALPAKRPSAPRALIGRDQETATLLHLWKRARSGRGQVVVVSGEPGIGKSHLCDAFLRHIAADPHRHIQYQCSALLRNNPLHPIIAQIEQDSGCLDDDTSEAKLQKIKSTILQYRPAKADEILLYSDLLSAGGKSSPQSGPITKSIRDRLFRRLTAHIIGLARETPVVHVVADPQWADLSTLEFIDKLASAAKAAPLLLLFQCRPEYSPKWLGADHVTLLSLDRLMPDDALSLLTTIPGADTLPARIKETIVDRSDGVPLFLEEITKSAVESAADVSDSNGAYQVPETLFGSLTARLDRLGTSKGVAQAASAVGLECQHALLKQITDLPNAKFDSSLQRLLDSQLMMRKITGDDSLIYVFKHALVRDAAYGTLPKSRRIRLHNSIANALLEQSPAGALTQAEVIAHHCSQAERHWDALGYWQKAADFAASRAAHREAIAHLNEALFQASRLSESAQRNEAELRIQTKLGNSLRAIDGWTAESAKTAYTRALQLCSHRSLGEHVFGPLFGLWAWHYVRPMLREALKYAERMMSIANSNSSPVFEVLGRQALGFTYFAQGRFAEADRELQLSIGLCDDRHVFTYLDLSGQDPRVHARLYRGMAQWFLGETAQGAAICREAFCCAQQSQDPFSEAMARTIMLRVHQLSGDPKLVAAEADEAIALCKEHGFSHYLSMALVLRGWARAMTGETDAGIAEINTALQQERRGGALLYETYALGLLAEACIKAERYEQSLGFLTRAAQLLRRDYSETFYAAEIYRLLAETWFRLAADLSEAGGWISKGLELAHAQGATSLERKLRQTAHRLHGRTG